MRIPVPDLLVLERRQEADADRRLATVAVGGRGGA